MKSIKGGNSFLIISVSCVVILLMISYFSFNMVMRETYSSFGGITGTITVSYKVSYSSNCPDGSIENVIYEDTGKKDYVLLNNMFDIPSGYEFVGWNTVSDGTGDNYLASSDMTLSKDIVLYAQWIEVEEVIAYGDINSNGVIDGDDYLLLEKHILGADILTGQALLNGDVNNDGNIDLVDVDIIKQVYLETDGYVGFLPSSPVLVYEIYKEVGANSSSTGESSDSGNTSGNNNASNGNGTGGSVTGGGTGNSGNGSNSLDVSGNVQGNNSLNDNSTVVDNNYNEDLNIDREISYKFVFMNENVEYASTSCDVLEDGTCNLILPVTNPSKSGYVFSGWSSVDGCPSGNGVVSSIVVNDSGTYYACFVENNSTNNTDSSGVNIWVIVIALWIIVISVISHLVIHFKKKNKIQDID